MPQSTHSRIERCQCLLGGYDRLANRADFDGYRSRGSYRLSDYQFNQIVPQVVLGNVLVWCCEL